MKKMFAYTALAVAFFLVSSTQETQAGLFGTKGKLKYLSSGSYCCDYSIWSNNCERSPVWNC